MGEHAAVYGRPAVTAALGLRLRVHLEPLSGVADTQEQVELYLPQLSHTSSTTWTSLKHYAQQVRQRWERYAEDPSPELFRQVRGQDPAHIVKVALGEAQEAFSLTGAARIRIVSDIPVGSGCGSSAAVTVAILGACAAFADRPVDAAALQPLALEVERRQHGLPSGVDTATVLHGGLLWVERTHQGTASLGELTVSPLSAAPIHLSRLTVLHTGQPTEETGAIVAHVRQRLRRQPGVVEGILDRMEAATHALRRHLDDPLAENGVRSAISGFQTCLEELGVVPEEVQTLVRRVEALGGAAKISGAGSLGGPGAGTLLVYHPKAGFPASQPFLAQLPRLAAPLGDTGLSIESGPPTTEFLRRNS